MNKKTIKKYAKEHKCSIREAQRQLGLEATGNMSVLSSPTPNVGYGTGSNFGDIKEENFDPNDESWKSIVDGREYFDPKWSMKYLHCAKDEEIQKTICASVSDEMMQWFIKSVADINPLELPEQHTFSNGYYTGHVHGKYTIASMQSTIMMLFPTGAYYEKNTVELFNKYKHLIKNDNMLYRLLVVNYQRNPSHVDLDEFNRIAMNMTLEDRLKLSDFGLETTVTKDSHEYIKELNGEHTYVYRTFRVKKGEAIRKGITKLDNSNWTTHEEGSGASYSLGKVRAITIAHWLHKSMLEKYGIGQDLKDMTKFLYSIDGGAGQTFDNPMQLQDDVYCAIGLFKIKKENVISATNAMGEDEIIIHPKNVELIDYRFLNIIDFISQYFVWMLSKVATDNFQSLKTCNRTDFLNEEGWYDICYDFLIHNDKVDNQFLSEFIKDYNNNHGEFFSKLHQMLFPNDTSYFVERVKHLRTGDMKYKLGTGRQVVGMVKDKVQPTFLPEIPKPNDPKSIRPKTGLYKSVA
jgi:hypothetical protein